MRTLADYSREKTLARQWMLSEIASMIRHIDLKANEAAAEQHRRFAQSLQTANPQEVATLLSKLAKQKNLYLAKILDQLINGLQGLSQALMQKPCQPIPHTLLKASESIPKITFQNGPIQPIMPPPIQAHVQAKLNTSKIDIKIQKESIITQHSLFANHKPLNHPPQPAKQSPHTSSNTESKKQQQSLSPSTIKVSEFSMKIGENHKLLKRLYEQGVSGEEVRAQNCLEMDNRIFAEASDYLAQVKTKTRGGHHSRSRLNQSPQVENERVKKSN